MTQQWLKVTNGVEKEVHVAAGQVLAEMHVTHWAKTQREDPGLNAVLDLLLYVVPGVHRVTTLNGCH